MKQKKFDTELEQAVYDWGRLGFSDWQKAITELGEEGFIELSKQMMDMHVFLNGEKNE